MSLKLKPLRDRVLVKRANAKDRTESGLVLPPSAQEKQDKGEVVAHGPGVWRDGVLQAVTVKTGDVVVFSKYAGSEVELNGEKYLLIAEDEIHGVLVEA